MNAALREIVNPDFIEFDDLDEAGDYMRKQGRLQFTVCAGISKRWAVRPKSDLEQEIDAYWGEFR